MSVLTNIHAFFCQAIITTMTIFAFVFIVSVIVFGIGLLVLEIKEYGGIKAFVKAFFQS